MAMCLRRPLCPSSAQAFPQLCIAATVQQISRPSRLCSKAMATRAPLDCCLRQPAQSPSLKSDYLRNTQVLRTLRESHAWRRNHKQQERRICASLAAMSAAAGVALQRPTLLDTAPVKHKLPGSGSGLSTNGDHPRGWPLLTPFTHQHGSVQEDDPRRSIVKAAPRATEAELSTAAQMARLSSLVYYPDPSDRLEALGLELKECQQTPYTAFFVADGPSDLFAPSGQGAQGERRKGCRRGEGKTRYIISRGVAMDRDEVKWADLWMKLLKFWPVEFERGLTPRGADLLVHEGVKEIAEDVYRALLPHLSFDPKKEGITAVQFGGHSLGGSLSLLLMLMFHLRSPLKRGWSSDIDFNAHTFGSFPVVASVSPFLMPWEDAQAHGGQSQHAMCPLMRTIESLRNQMSGGGDSTDRVCSVLADLGLPAGAARGCVLDSDIIPRAFLALKHDGVRSLLELKERLAGGAWTGAGQGYAPPPFKPVGLVHYMQSQGEEVSVASLQPSLAEKALHMDFHEFVRNPSLLGKSIHDHYFNHYVTRLESALATTRLQGSGN